MTLGQFATAVNATPRWVLNALARLGHKRAYSEPLARRLALARYLAEGVGMPLTEAWEVARDVLALPMTGVWRRESLGGVTLTIELGRFYTTYGAHLALVNAEYGEGLRGRRPSRRQSAIQRAKDYGIDVTLLDSALRRTPEERLKMLSENMAFLAKLREAMRAAP